MDESESQKSEEMGDDPPREIITKFIGGPKDGDTGRCAVDGKLAVYTMVLATKAQPYLIRRKLVASIYRFVRWTADDAGTPIAELRYVKSQDHKSAAETIERHEHEYVNIPEATP